MIRWQPVAQKASERGAYADAREHYQGNCDGTHAPPETAFYGITSGLPVTR